MIMSVQTAIEALKGELLVEPSVLTATISSLQWDSRQVKPGSAFLAVPGEKVDGNSFTAKAIQSGALMAICTRNPGEEALGAARDSGAAVLVAPDYLDSVAKLAASYREHLTATVVAVTGSNGKTTVKNMISALASSQFACASTTGNQNNELGAPATTLSASPSTEVLVVEMGMRGRHQIEAMCEYVKPDIGVVTNVGTAHMELLGSRENIALAKSELLAALPDNKGIAVVNGDDKMTPVLLQAAELDKRGVQVLSFGLSQACSVRGYNLEFSSLGFPSFDASFPDGSSAHIQLCLPGQVGVVDALAASAVAFALGIPANRIALVLGLIGAEAMHMKIHECKNGSTLIDDTYNASPESMRSSISVLTHMDKASRYVAILGDMGELGEDSAKLHQELGKYCVEQGVEVLVTVGDLSKYISAGAKQAGMDPSKILECDDVNLAIEDIRSILQPGDIALVKASRFMQFERIVKGLVD